MFSVGGLWRTRTDLESSPENYRGRLNKKTDPDDNTAAVSSIPVRRASLQFSARVRRRRASLLVVADIRQSRVLTGQLSSRYFALAETDRRLRLVEHTTTL